LQYFPRKFSLYIKKYLDLPAKLEVYCQAPKPIVVTMIMGKGKGAGAQITSKWSKVVKAAGMQSGDVFMFRFRRSARVGLKLAITKVM
jgi:hypothetical protein